MTAARSSNRADNIVITVVNTEDTFDEAVKRVGAGHHAARGRRHLVIWVDTVDDPVFQAGVRQEWHALGYYPHELSARSLARDHAQEILDLGVRPCVQCHHCEQVAPMTWYNSLSSVARYDCSCGYSDYDVVTSPALVLVLDEEMTEAAAAVLDPLPSICEQCELLSE